MNKANENQTPLELIRVPLCGHCIAREEANDEYISVGRITKAKKCYFCDDTDTQLYMCSIEP